MSSLTAGASAEAEGAGPGAESPQTQGDLPEVAQTSGNVCSSLIAPRVTGKGLAAGREASPTTVFFGVHIPSPQEAVCS